ASRRAPTGGADTARRRPGGAAGRAPGLIEADGGALVLEAAQRHRDGDAERLRGLALERAARLLARLDLHGDRLARGATHRLARDAAAGEAELARGLLRQPQLDLGGPGRVAAHGQAN